MTERSLPELARIAVGRGRSWIVVATVALALASLACSGMGGRKPGWMDGELPPEFPKQKYVTALATGATLADAQVNAKSELSRIFSADLRSEIELLETESAMGERVSLTEDMRINTTISSALELQGVEVPLHWRDPGTEEIWALAVLERRKECSRIRSEGKDLVIRLEALSADVRTQSNPLVAVRSAVHAAKVGRQLDVLEARSRVLGSPCLAQRPVSTGSLEADLDARLRSLSFVVNARGFDSGTGQSEPLPQLRERIAGNLTRLGFQVGPADGVSVIPVDARLRLRRVTRGTDWVEYRWEGAAEIGGPVPGDPAIIAAESDGAESHPEPATAKLRARRKGEIGLSQRLDDLLKQFLGDGAES